MNSIQTIESVLDIQFEVKDRENFMRFVPRTEGKWKVLFMLSYFRIFLADYRIGGV